MYVYASCYQGGLGNRSTPRHCVGYRGRERVNIPAHPRKQHKHPQQLKPTSNGINPNLCTMPNPVFVMATQAAWTMLPAAGCIPALVSSSLRLWQGPFRHPKRLLLYHFQGCNTLQYVCTCVTQRKNRGPTPVIIRRANNKTHSRMTKTRRETAADRRHQQIKQILIVASGIHHQIEAEDEKRKEKHGHHAR